MRFSRWGLIAAFCALCASATADTLYLINGDQVIGSILQETPEEFIVEVPGDPPIQVKLRRSDVIDIIRGQQAAAPIPAQASGTVESMLKNLPPVEAEFQPPSADEGPMPLLPVVLPQGGIFQITGAGVRFREGPSLSFPVKETLSSRTLLIEIEIVDGWLHAKTVDGVEGWIHPSFVARLERQPCLVDGDLVNVREAPGDVYRSLGRLRKGDVVVKVEEREGWSRVFSGQSLAGWVSSEFIAPLENPQALAQPSVVIRNEEAGMPAAMERQTGPGGGAQLRFVIRDERLVRTGMAKLLVFHRDPQRLQAASEEYGGEAVYRRETIVGEDELAGAGFPASISGSFAGAEALTLLGERTPLGWSYSLIAPDDPSASFGFVVQRGPSRGSLILIDGAPAAQQAGF